MLDSQSSRKIVVAVGLAVVFGALIFEFVVPSGHVDQVAQSRPAPAVPPPAAQTSSNPTAPAQTAATQTPPTDQTVTPPSSPDAPAAAVAAAAPPSATPNSADDAASDVTAPAEEDSSTPAKPKRSSHHSQRRVAKTDRGTDADGASGASAVASNANPGAASPTSTPNSANTDSDLPAALASGQAPSTAGAPADTQQTPATPAVTSNQPVASDTQITADVKSQIAAATPDSNVDVTTTNGVVVLAGSASSQDAADRAKQAALRVAGVKNVDASALKVSGLR